MITTETKFFPPSLEPLNQALEQVKSGSLVALEIVARIATIALQIIKNLACVGLIIIFPGSFIFGTFTGITIGVLATPKYLTDTMNRITKIWQRQNWTHVTGIIVMSLWGLPYTPYFGSFLLGMHFGVTKTLE